MGRAAGIIDPYGGLRVVVSDGRLREFNKHLRPDEILLIVPSFRVEVPVPWEKIPAVIARVERYVAWWIKTRNDPDTLKQDAVVFYKLRQSRGYQKSSVHLPDIVET